MALKRYALLIDSMKTPLRRSHSIEAASLKRDSGATKTPSWWLIAFCLIFATALFFRFFELDARMQFTWDQIENAWTMKGMIDDHIWPLRGMVAKGNSGVFIGPGYYYLLVPFYFATGLDPIGGAIFAGVVSIATALLVLYVGTKIFTYHIGIASFLLYSTSYYVILFDRVPWPVVLLAGVSTLVFFALYKVLAGDARYIMLLALGIGIAIHVHFTAVYYVAITVLCLPFFPWNKQSIRPILIGCLIIAVSFVPSIISEITSSFSSTRSLFTYSGTYSHGFHLRRFFQLFNDSLIEFEKLLIFRELKVMRIIIPVTFFLHILLWNRSKIRLAYLTAVWLLVPWVFMTIYSGEISNYYFSSTRVIAILMFAYVWYVLFVKSKLLGYILSVGVALFIIQNGILFFTEGSYGKVAEIREQVKKDIREGRPIEFVEGDPKSFFYYIYEERTKAR